MADELKLNTSYKSLTIKNCFEKLKDFSENDAFPRYDVTGYKYAHQSDCIQNELLTVTNREMMARSSRKAWEPFLNKPLNVLANISVDADLIDSPDTVYFNARERLGLCYLMITAARWITDMAASKLLYLKRPKLVAISDSYVRKMLNVPEPDTRNHPWRAPFFTARALSVCDAVRRAGQENITLLNSLQEKMSPIFISKARIMDILIWIEMAIAQGHSRWKPQSELKKWDCSVEED